MRSAAGVTTDTQSQEPRRGWGRFGEQEICARAAVQICCVCAQVGDICCVLFECVLVAVALACFACARGPARGYEVGGGASGERRAERAPVTRAGSRTADWQGRRTSRGAQGGKRGRGEKEDTRRGWTASTATRRSARSLPNRRIWLPQRAMAASGGRQRTTGTD